MDPTRQRSCMRSAKPSTWSECICVKNTAVICAGGAELRKPHGGSAAGVELQLHRRAIVAVVTVADERAGPGETIEFRWPPIVPVSVTIMHGAEFAAVGPKLADNAHTQMTSSNVRLIIGTPKKCFKRPPLCHFHFTVSPGRCPLWVKSGHVQRKTPCPLYPNSGHVQRTGRCPLCANSGHQRTYSDPNVSGSHFCAQLGTNSILRNIGSGKQIVVLNHQGLHGRKFGIAPRMWRDLYSAQLRAQAKRQERL